MKTIKSRSHLQSLHKCNRVSGTSKSNIIASVVLLQMMTSKSNLLTPRNKSQIFLQVHQITSFLDIWRGPAQDVPYNIILWYVSKIVYLLQEQEQFSINTSNLFFDLIALIALIVRAFIVRYQYYTINFRYKNVTQSALFFVY